MGLIKTDSDFETALGEKFKIHCWTLSSEIFLEKILPYEYSVKFFDDGKESFANTSGINFQIHFDSAQRFVALYFHNGTKGWYLGNEDMWDDVNLPIAKLFSTKRDLMNRVFTSAVNGGSIVDVLNEENMKHFYNITTSKDPSKNYIFLVPKGIWQLDKNLSKVNQVDYKVLEEKGVDFKHIGFGEFDPTIFQNVDAFLAVRGFGKNQDFTDFSNKISLDVDAHFKVEDESDTSSEASPSEYDNLSPSDYYYFVEDLIGNVTITVTPKDYFDKNNGVLYDHFVFPHEDILTSGQFMESIWCAREGSTVDDVKKEFDALGFVYNQNIR